ncbi:Uncharacterized protein PHSC3_000056 [Chlamydiales bacterium STE3]|nr:Uncharacterized protein PHSC3_000056 [Chlamydiales bacterium STE3]
MTESLFEENLNKFSKICVKTSLILPNLETCQFEPCLTQQGEFNIKKNGLFLHSQKGAIEEAQNLLKPILCENLETLYIYGIGLGYNYFAAREWLKENPDRKIIFLEDDLSFLKFFLSTERAAEILNNRQVRIAVVNPDLMVSSGKMGVDGAEVFLERCRTNYSTVALPFYWTNRRDDFRKVIQGISKLLFIFSNRLFEEVCHELLAPNFYSKFAKIHETQTIKGLLGMFANIPCFIIGAGPSLQKDLPLLAELEDKALFFAAGSAVNVLNSSGIYSHFGGGIDPTKVQISRMRTNAAFETPFFYTNRFNSEAFDLIHGPKIFTPQDPEKKWYAWFQNEVNIANPFAINTGFSTSNFCTSIALHLGCNPIIYLGMDMAYSEGVKYTSGVEAYPGDSKEVQESLKKQHPDAIRVANYEGKVFDTTISFIHESNWMTVQALEHSKTQFLYGSMEGFGVNKVERKSLKEIAEHDLKRQYDLLNQIHTAIESSYNRVLQKDVQRTLQKWKRSLSQCLYLLMKMERECQQQLKKIKNGENFSTAYTPQWIIDEMALEHEPAFQNLLKNVCEATELFFMGDRMDFRYHESPSFREKILLELSIKQACYVKMIEVGKLHMQPLKSSLKRWPKIKPKKSEFLKLDKSDSYSFENGILCIFDEELSIAIKEPFCPSLIPTDLMETPEWKNRLPIREVYVYKDKIMEGECIQYYPDGSIKARQFYQDGLLHGPSIFFSLEGNILAQSWFYKGKREGKTQRFFISGEYSAIERWRNGLREGKQLYFYPEGAIKTFLEFNQGILHGKVELFYLSGQLKFSSHFLKGKRSGKEQFFYLDGTKISEVEYDANQPIGTAFFWHPNGQLAKKIVFSKEGREHILEWDIKGKKLIEEHFTPAHPLMKEAEILKQSIVELMNGK